MREINTDDKIIKICTALSSKLRMQVIHLLSKSSGMNLKELAVATGISNGAITAHIKILEETGIINVEHSSGIRGSQKICSLNDTRFLLKLLTDEVKTNSYEVNVPIGQYVNYAAQPTCGLATKDSIIGEVDDPRYFAAPERINAGILWISNGFLEYRIPNYLKIGQVPEEIQFSFELSSEAPGVCANWPSDIYFYFNDVCLGVWTSPGDFGDKNGLYSPAWWPNNWNQYGMLKLLSISNNGVFIDGTKISNGTLKDLNIDNRSEFRLRLSLDAGSSNVGGLTIFGKDFGNYNQDIKVRITYGDTSGILSK